MKESTLQCHVADYLRLQYPHVLFHSDFGAGVKLTPGQARIQYRQNGGRRAWPDMFIAEPKYQEIDSRRVQMARVMKYAGLMIELKREGARIYKKDGTLVADAHIREQHDLLCELERRGYKACFAVGFDQAKQIIDDYLGKRHEEVGF